MTSGKHKLYWLGNVAKTRIVDEILHSLSDNKSITVFDFGCGDAGDWPEILKDNPLIRLVAYEPGRESSRRAAERLQGLNAEVLSGDSIDSLVLQADFIVSFSVFEHVVDQEAFLLNAKRLLAPHGVFYLNYDDGHFRNALDLSEIATWLPALRARIRTLLSPFLASVGQQTGYQRRVVARQADHLVADAGFLIHRIDYHNLASLKELAKSMPVDLRENFSRWWLNTEIELNHHFSLSLPDSHFGDKTNLWRQMASRTLQLRHP